ncbi:hypothetical protein [Cupriavidus oxalaticus]|nr:hypothetical protein [Cupriavidus oxalaticus]QRQ87843.1 hypothetical protein JTE91_14610 [Cupriavidus oxalaticus]QRQ93830.1 hypothetical protein JTE92_27655 [Cupriavidus oxalaticus]WQD82462.1 hypothetical protein U0036_15400 [Cupriavidus oxalaticus]
MEEYELASASRRADVEMLLSGGNPRTTAAVHLGGVAVECKLKALIAEYHEIDAWEECSRRKKDPRLGQPIPRPGHGLFAAIKLMDTVYRKAKADPMFLSHLDRVMHPAGATSLDFIELRYVASELDRNALSSWQQSFRYVVNWLIKNKGS